MIIALNDILVREAFRKMNILSNDSVLLILGAILPVIITVFLGYVSGRRKDFAWEHAGAINKLVMLYALPLSISAIW